MLVDLALRVTTVCGAFFAFRHFYDLDRRQDEIHNKALDEVVSKAMKKGE